MCLSLLAESKLVIKNYGVPRIQLNRIRGLTGKNAFVVFWKSGSKFRGGMLEFSKKSSLDISRQVFLGPDVPRPRESGRPEVFWLWAIPSELRQAEDQRPRHQDHLEHRLPRHGQTSCSGFWRSSHYRSGIILSQFCPNTVMVKG